jgi:hypothetical protein
MPPLYGFPTCPTSVQLAAVTRRDAVSERPPTITDERSVIELYVDMELIHRDKIVDGVLELRLLSSPPRSTKCDAALAFVNGR